MIDKRKDRLRYFWKYKGEVKDKYNHIYNTLFEVYKARQEYRNKWMVVINTFIIFRQLSVIYDSFIRRKEYLYKLKQDMFTIWKHSKDTKRTIQKCKDIKNLKLIYTTTNLMFNLKKNHIKERYSDIIGQIFIKYYIKTKLTFILKRFSIKSKLISQ